MTHALLYPTGVTLSFVWNCPECDEPLNWGAERVADGLEGVKSVKIWKPRSVECTKCKKAFPTKLWRKTW